jgi:hypothetical protein
LTTIVIAAIVGFVSYGLSEDRNVTVDKDSPSGSATFSDTKTSDKGYLRNLTIGTSDNGKIIAAQILANAENNAWRSNSEGLPDYQVRFTGTQNAGAASDGSVKKEYVPKFHGKALVNGTGSGTPQEYSWNVKAIYNISDHDPIVNDSNEMKSVTSNGTNIVVKFNSSEDVGTWKNYQETQHGFNVSASNNDYSTIHMRDVLTFIQIPGTDAAEADAACYYNADQNILVGTSYAVWQHCSICQRDNKYVVYVIAQNTVAASAAIHMPQWTNINVAAQPAKDMWNTFLGKVLQHERNHWNKVVDYIKPVKNWADSVKGKAYVIEVCYGNNKTQAQEKASELAEVKKEKLLEIVTSYVGQNGNEFKQKLIDIQEQYDNVSNHGISEGCVFAKPFWIITDTSNPDE